MCLEPYGYRRILGVYRWDIRKHKGIVKTGSNVRILRVNVGLVDSHAFAGETGCIIYRHIVEVRVFLPIFVQDKQKLLSTAENKSWAQTRR
jgi:hypothetical protein